MNSHSNQKKSKSNVKDKLIYEMLKLILIKKYNEIKLTLKKSKNNQNKDKMINQQGLKNVKEYDIIKQLYSKISAIISQNGRRKLNWTKILGT